MEITYACKLLYLYIIKTENHQDSVCNVSGNCDSKLTNRFDNKICPSKSFLVITFNDHLI